MNSVRETRDPWLYQFCRVILVMAPPVVWGASELLKKEPTCLEDCRTALETLPMYFTFVWFIVMPFIWLHWSNLIWLMECENARIQANPSAAATTKGSEKAHSLEDMKHWDSLRVPSPRPWLRSVEFHGWHGCVAGVIAVLLGLLLAIGMGVSSAPK